MLDAMPSLARRALLRVGRRVRTDIFQVPDAMRDFARLCARRRPEAVLDVGAHVGQTARELVRRLPDVPIHCFEPTPETVVELRRRVAHLPHVRVHPVALADREASLRFHINQNSQTNSLLDNDGGNSTFLGAATAHVGQTEVASTTLDAWAAANVPGRGDLALKADVQGAELLLIHGGLATLASRVTLFYTEVSLANLYRGQGDLFSIHAALTTDLPFVLYQIYRTRSADNGRALWADAMWVRRDMV